jgi:hypothetical protein
VRKWLCFVCGEDDSLIRSAESRSRSALVSRRRLVEFGSVALRALNRPHQWMCARPAGTRVRVSRQPAVCHGSAEAPAEGALAGVARIRTAQVKTAPSCRPLQPRASWVDCSWSSQSAGWLVHFRYDRWERFLAPDARAASLSFRCTKRLAAWTPRNGVRAM